MAKYRIRDGQSIYDVALQLHGSLDQVVAIVDASEGIANLDQELLTGVEAEYDESINDNPDVISFVEANAAVFATANPKVQVGGDYDPDDYLTDIDYY